MNGLEGAKCRGRWWLFDSTDPADHAEAKKACDTCPAIEACRKLLEAERTIAKFSKSAAPRGTWAGQLLGEKSFRKALPREHGSDRGYYQHRYRREDACADCRRAHVDATRTKVAS